MYCAFTIDVESDLPEINFSDISEIFYILDLLDDLKIHSTFFLTGRFIEKMPEIFNIISSKGHEVAFHGYAHEAWSKGLSEKVNDLQRLKKLTHKLNFHPFGFRAPFLTVNSYILKILRRNGFVYDSSFLRKRLFKPIQALLRISRVSHLYESELMRKPNNLAPLEFPVSTLPFSGIPYSLNWFCVLGLSTYKTFISSTIMNDGILIFYMHPYDLVSRIQNKAMPLLRYVPWKRPRATLIGFLHFLLKRKVKFTRLIDLAIQKLGDGIDR